MADNQTFRNREIALFYWIVAGLPTLVFLLSLAESEWRLGALILVIIVGFLFFGWPLTAEVTQAGNILFKGPIRRIMARQKISNLHTTTIIVTLTLLELGYASYGSL